MFRPWIHFEILKQKLFRNICACIKDGLWPLAGNSHWGSLVEEQGCFTLGIRTPSSSSRGNVTCTLSDMLCRLISSLDVWLHFCISLHASDIKTVAIFAHATHTDVFMSLCIWRSRSSCLLELEAALLKELDPQLHAHLATDNMESFTFCHRYSTAILSSQPNTSTLILWRYSGDYYISQNIHTMRFLINIYTIRFLIKRHSDKCLYNN